MLKIKYSENIFFTSDPHFFHDNIIKYCNRPCTIEDHTEWLLDILNKDLDEDSIVFMLGDFVGNNKKHDGPDNKSRFKSLQEVISKLKGTWYFIKGNHDNENQIKSLLKNTRHSYLGDYSEILIGNKSFILFHFPIENWNKKHYNSIHLHGHLHNNKSPKIENRFNVSLDIEHKVYNIKEFYKAD